MAWVNTGNVDAYIVGLGDPKATIVAAAALDDAAIHLRESFGALYHVGSIPYEGAYAKVIDAGLLERIGDTVVLSDAGALRADAVFARMA